VEFRSVVDAVRCAIEVQNAMVERNAGLPPERRIEFRVGIHLGDVVEESDGDLMGDGVNIAARLEGVATPGAICLSEDAYRQVKSRLDLLVSDLGETKLKNIAEPMRVFALQVGVAANVQRAPEAAATVSTSALPEKPSIAVLPFTNMSGDPEQEYFVDGMVEDIITALSRFNQLFVIARNSTFTYKSRAVDVRQVAKELGVRYVLEGGVRKAGNRLRITGQLIDAATGGHLWADRFDGGLEDVFDLQDKITGKVVGAIEPTLRKAEIERARRKPVENLDAYDLYLRALPHIYAIRPDENLLGFGLLSKAIDLAPNYALALGHTAWCLTQRVTRGWPPASADDAATATGLARRAAAAGNDDAVALALAGFALVAVGRDYSTGLDAARRAVEQNPGSSFVNFMAGSAMVWSDDLENGLILLERAMALGPLDPSFFMNLVMVAAAELCRDRPERAIELAQRSAALNPNWDSACWVLAAAYARLDRLEEARAALANFLAQWPAATVTTLRRRLPFRSGPSFDMILDGLRKAGLPE
jgi:TolB-like protein